MHKVRIQGTHKGYTFYTHGAADHIAKTMGHGNWYEAVMLRDIRTLGLEGVYIDVGAHIGNHTVFFAEECPSTEVVAIECAAFSFSLLQRNCAQNITKPYHTVNAAVGLDGEAVDVVAWADPRQTGSTHLAPGTQRLTQSLDSLLPDVEPVLIKLDVEGYELKALQGAMAMLKRSKPLLVIEVWDGGLPAVMDLLGPLGYAVPRSRYNHTPTYMFPHLTAWPDAREQFAAWVERDDHAELVEWTSTLALIGPK